MVKPDGMPREADLHIHTDVSDGTFTPEEAVSCACKIGLAAIAIADHDAVNAIDLAISAAAGTGLEIVPSVELTAEVDGREMHLLGYHIDWHDLSLRRQLAEFQKDRQRRAELIIERLAGLGIYVPLELVMSFSGGASVGRLHIARAMAAAGAIRQVRDAFRYYIGDGGPAYVAKNRLKPVEAIQMVLDVGGVPVLAHPGVLARDDLIEGLVGDGLRGIEVYHLDHGPEKVKRYDNLAKRYGLLVTGGSDCHGNATGRVMMGRVKIPYRLVRRLAEEHGDTVRRLAGIRSRQSSGEKGGALS